MLNLIFRTLRHLWFNEDGFFGIGGGPSNEEKSQYADEAGLANFATSEGEGDILASDKFWKSILAGDTASISKVLGPEMSAVNKQGQQAKKTASEFGNRSGGTNAGMQMADDTTRTTVDEMLSSLTGKAAGALGSSGSSLLSTGSGAHSSAFDMSHVIQQQHKAKMDDLFKSIADVATSVAGGFGGAPTAAFGKMKPGQISGAFGGPTSVDTLPSPIDSSDWTIQ